MIDTGKYEGHLAHLEYELWAFTDFMDINATHEERCATDALLNDAPLLLEEVKRLRREKKELKESIRKRIINIDSIEWAIGEIIDEYEEIKKVLKND